MSQKKVWFYPQVRQHQVGGLFSFALAIVGMLTIPKNDLLGLFLAYTVFALGMIASVVDLVRYFPSRKLETEVNNLLIKQGYNLPHQCEIYLSYNLDGIGMIDYNDRCYYLTGDDISRIRVTAHPISKKGFCFYEVEFCSASHEPRFIGIVADRSNFREYVYKK